MNIWITELMSVFWDSFKVLSVPFIVIGVLNCFFGYKIFRIVCAINGFLVGAIPGAIIGLFAGFIDGKASGEAIVIFALIGGIIGAVLAYAVQLIAVFFSCFGTGVLIGAILMILSKNYSGIFQSAMIWGLLFGVLGVLLAKTMVILQTTIIGTLQIGMGFFMFTHSGLSAGAAIILFFVLGLVVQFRNSGQKATACLSQAGEGAVTASEVTRVSAPVSQGTEQSVPQETGQSVLRETEQGTVQGAGQSERSNREQEMAQKARQVMQETKSTLQVTLKKAKEDSGKYIDIATEHGKKAETKIEEGIFLLQKILENIWEYFENNKKSLFPIMCAALVVASVMALL